jgi:hypothetical protein
MKFLFDPKWLPELKEVDVPVVVVGAGRDQILEDIRSMVRTMRNEPMVMLDMATPQTHSCNVWSSLIPPVLLGSVCFQSFGTDPSGGPGPWHE